MATSVRLIRRYVWLIDTIRRAGQITLEEINRKWMDERTLRLEHEEDIPERTFHRHRQAIADIFGIDIICNRYNGNTYYIENDDALNEPSFTSWLFNGLAIDNQLIENREVRRRILFDEIPGGTALLPAIISAMNQLTALIISYCSLSHEPLDHAMFLPYFLKQWRQRWYLIGSPDGRAEIRVLALDRISELKQTDTKFEYDPGINPDTYFDEVVGILLDDEYDCEPVTVRIYGKQAHYVELLPIHKSQRAINRGRGYIDFQYNLRPEYEFIHEILRLGSDAEVLAPQWVRKEIPWQAQEIVKRYN